MDPELMKMLEEWKKARLYKFEERGYKISANPSMEKEFCIELAHTAKIRIGKRSYPFKSKKRFITFSQHDAKIPAKGDAIRLGWAMQELGKKFEGKVNKNLAIIYKYFDKKAKK